MTNTLAESLKEYRDAFPEEGRLDALHQLFYGFYSRIAVVDRTTQELARWAKDDLSDIENLPSTLAEALRDNALHVGRDLFGAHAGDGRAAARLGRMQVLRRADDDPCSPSAGRSPSTRRAGRSAPTTSPSRASTRTCPTTRSRTTPRPKTLLDVDPISSGSMDARAGSSCSCATPSDPRPMRFTS